jgi:two-component system, NtrC family, response regulator AtoC
LNLQHLFLALTMESPSVPWYETCFVPIPEDSMTAIATHSLYPLADAHLTYGKAANIQSLNSVVIEIARTDIPILLVGESGTGKEVYARWIHRLSGLSEGPLKKVNCAATEAGELLRNMREERASSSGSQDGGPQTVFLDGVHELDGTCQRVLLSLLPDGEPGESSGRTALRIISSTPRNLEMEVASGRFLRELYFRINGAILRLPPLRERKEDIPLLLEYFLLKYSNELKKSMPHLTGDVRELLDSYDWPGNIRELENVAKKIVAVGDPTLALADLRATHVGVQMADEKPPISSLKVASRTASRQAERELIQKALERTHWNRKRAAQDLQISYKSLLYKIKQTGLEGKKAG